MGHSKPKLTIIFPWSNNVSQLETGATLRTGLLLEYLKKQYIDITLVQFDDHNSVKEIDGVRYVRIYQGLFNHGLILDSIILFPRVVLHFLVEILDWFTKSMDFKRLRWYEPYQYQPSYIPSIRRFVKNSNIVLLEYDFLAQALIPYCHRREIKVILTFHDLIFKDISQPWVRRRVERKEIQAARMADSCFTVSEADRDYLLSKGITEVTALSHSIDCHYPEVNKTDQAEITKKYCLPCDKPFAIFIGSDHPPNIEAVDKILLIASQVTALNIIVVGSCCKNRKSINNVFFTGTVLPAELPILYSLSTIALIPLNSVTGSSLKFIEAIKYGLPVITTPAGRRGYEFTPGVNGFMAKNVGQFIKQLNRLADNPDQMARISANNRQLAAKYDYRICYQPYTDLIEAYAN